MRLKKNFIFIISLFICLPVFVSCSSDSSEEVVTPTLTLNISDVNMKVSGEEITVKVEATSTWTFQVENNVDWLTAKASATQPTEFTIKASANTLTQKRSANVIVKLDGTDLSKSVKVEQAAASAVLTVTPNEITDIPVLGNTYSFVVTTSGGVDWTYEIPVAEKGWISEKAKTDSSVELAFAANTSSQRGCYITFKDKNNKASDFKVKVIQLKNDNYDPEDPAFRGYTLQSTMKGDETLLGKTYNDVHTYMKKYGWDYSEHPNSSDKDHKDGKHMDVVYDATLKQYVFRFINHAGEFLDGDRGSIDDRQRNEMKSQTSTGWAKMNGNWGESQILKWKFKIPTGFRPSSSFTHIHQLKAQEGDNGAPIITISLRGNNDGSNRRVQVIHSLGSDKSAGTSGKGTFVDNIPITKFEDEWVQVEEEVMYDHHGKYSLKITRVRDGEVLINTSIADIDTWRKGAINIRNKFGIYRSFGTSMKGPDDRPTNGIKDETLDLADFEIYEKDSNPNPQIHD